MEKARILFMIGTLLGGGAEKVLYEIVKNLDREKFKITVQTVYDQGIYIEDIKQYAEYKTIFRTYATTQEEVAKLRRYQLYLLSLSEEAFSKEAIDEEYDIEVAFLEDESTKIIANSPNKNSRKIAWVHTDVVNNSNAAYFYPTHEQQRECYEKYNDIVFVSSAVKNAFIDRFQLGGNFHIINNPINASDILAKANLDNSVLSNKFRIISIGRLCPVKGFDRLLIVHRQLIQEGFDYELVILGEGEQQSLLEQFVNENNLNDHTKFLGFQSNPYPYIHQADLLVSASYAEGFSTVIAESLILGTPVVTTKCSGTEELVGESQYGLVVDNDIQKLYEGIRYLLTHTLEYHKYQHAARFRGEMFNLNETIQVIEELLKN